MELVVEEGAMEDGRRKMVERHEHEPKPKDTTVQARAEAAISAGRCLLTLFFAAQTPIRLIGFKRRGQPCSDCIGR